MPTSMIEQRTGEGLPLLLVKGDHDVCINNNEDHQQRRIPKEEEEESSCYKSRRRRFFFVGSLLLIMIPLSLLLLSLVSKSINNIVVAEKKIDSGDETSSLSRSDDGDVTRVSTTKESSCTKLVEGVFDVTCMPFGDESSGTGGGGDGSGGEGGGSGGGGGGNGIATAKYVGWESTATESSVSASSEPSSSSMSRVWKYLEISDPESQQRLFDNQQYLEYASNVVHRSENSYSSTKNCHMSKFVYHFKLVRTDTSVLGDENDGETNVHDVDDDVDDSFIETVTDWSWNSADSGQDILLSSSSLTCPYSRIVDTAICRSTINSIVQTFKKYGTPPDIDIDADLNGKISILCQK